MKPNDAPPVVQNLTQFCVANGYPTSADVESHIHAGLRSAPTSKSYQRRFDTTLHTLQAGRDRGTSAYREAVASGRVVDPDAVGRTARLIAAASGHPDNESTKAALRLLQKRKEADDGYREAFYAIAEVLGIVPDGVSSPKHVFESVMLPRLAVLARFAGEGA